MVSIPSVRQKMSPIGIVAPMRTRIGDIFWRTLGIDTIFFSFATSDEDYHAPNEFFRLASFDSGLKAWTLYLARLGQGATSGDGGPMTAADARRF